MEALFVIVIRHSACHVATHGGVQHLCICMCTYEREIERARARERERESTESENKSGRNARFRASADAAVVAAAWDDTGGKLILNC